MGIHNQLPEGTKLHWYRIESMLGHGGFGLTYLALDTNLNKKVAIKEYLPGDLADRASDSTVNPRTEDHEEVYAWGLQRFLEEARTLVQFNHRNIVRVMSVFEANNTAYMVMEYEQGEDLNTLMRQGQYRTEAELKGVIYPILDGLVQVHEAGFIHRDIKPGNIYIRTDKSPVLLDFGSARQSVGSQTQALTSLYTPGFAPFEQYHESEGRQGPWTDVYALGAMLYLATTGQRPADAMKRSAAYLHGAEDPYTPVAQQVKGKFSKAFLNAIDQALCFYEKDRPQNTQAFKQLLEGKKVKATPAQKVKAPTTKPVASAGGQSNRWLIAAALVLVVGIGVTGYGWWAQQQASQSTVEMVSVSNAPAKAQMTKEPSKIDTLLITADKHMQSGKLLGAGDDNALAQYKAVLVLDNSNVKAKDGIDIIQSRYLEQVEQLLSTGQYDRTREALRAGTTLFGNTADLQALEDRLEATLIEEQKQKAQAEAKRLAETEKQKAAQEAKRKAEDDKQKLLAEQQRQAEEKSRQAQQKKQQQINQLLVQATQAIATGKLANTADGNDALSYYQQILKVDPGNETALDGIATLTEKLSSQAQLPAAKNGASSISSKPKTAILVVYADMVGEVDQSSRTLGNTLKKSSSEYIKTTEFNINENIFIPSKQYQAAKTICADNTRDIIIGANFEKTDTGGGGFSQGDLKLLAFSCVNEAMVKKTYVVWTGSEDWSSTVDAWIPDIIKSIKQFFSVERVLSI